MEKQKWINEGGIYYPIPGYATIYTSPGNGVFQIHVEKQTGRLGLTKVDDTFVFDFKLYDLGCDDIFDKVISTWFSDTFSKANKNLGVIFNGIKGTGKTIAAKVLSNRIGLPVIIVSNPVDGLLPFIQSLCFECVILIDEAEKTFDDDKEVLLKMIDGVYNNSRKLYLLTTNRLTVDENLIGRPGRIRYIREFGNLTPKAINDYIDDNLQDKSKKESILELVDSLLISTIDILKAIVDEVNIHGEVPDGKMLNIPKADYHIDIIKFVNVDSDRYEELKSFIVKQAGDIPINVWLKKNHGKKAKDEEDFDDFAGTNRGWVCKKFACWSCDETIPSSRPYLCADMTIRNGKVTSDPDKNGFFTYRNDWDDKETICLVAGNHGTPSLYRGGLWC